MSTTIKARLSLATAAALIAIASASFATAASAADQQEKPGRCYGVNSCKGESQCATSKNDCKGLNSCKGKGVVLKAPSECLKAGGTLTESK